MKKIISLILVLLMVSLLNITAFANSELFVNEGTETLNQEETYDFIGTLKNGKIIIEEGTDIEISGNISNEGTFEINGSLYGTISSFNNSGSFILGTNGWINLLTNDVFRMENIRDRLNQAGIETEVEELENGEYRITAGTNPAEREGHVHKYVCAVCGDTYLEEENALAASNFGSGCPAIIVGAVCLIVGFAGAAFLFKKKNKI